MEPSLAWFQAWGGSWGSSWGPLHEVHDPVWDTAQGIAPNWVKFDPVKSVTVSLGATSAAAGSNGVGVETRSVTEACLRGVPVFAGAAPLSVQTVTVVSPSRHGAGCGTSRTCVTSFASVGVTGASASANAGVVYADGWADVVLGSRGSKVGKPPRLSCTTVKNPTDEELLMMIMRTIRIDTTHANM